MDAWALSDQTPGVPVLPCHTLDNDGNEARLPDRFPHFSLEVAQSSKLVDYVCEGLLLRSIWLSRLPPVCRPSSLWRIVLFKHHLLTAFHFFPASCLCAPGVLRRLQHRRRLDGKYGESKQTWLFPSHRSWRSSRDSFVDVFVLGFVMPGTVCPISTRETHPGG